MIVPPWPADLEYTTNDQSGGRVHLVHVDDSRTACGHDGSRWPWRFRAGYDHPDLCVRCRKTWPRMLRQVTS